MMNELPDRHRVADRVTIYPRGKKKIYCADFWDNGHRRRSLRTANKKIALQRAATLEAELASGHYQSPAADIRIADVIDDYLKFLKTENRSLRTLRKYRSFFNIFLRFLGEHQVQHLHRLSNLILDRFRADRKLCCSVKTMYCEGVIVKQLYR
jgi:hypothetical protein